MINIAICDDDKTITSVIENMINVIADAQQINVNCDVFFDGASLIDYISHGTFYELIYMDIEMDRIDGIHAAEIIRKNNISTLIVYISSYEKYLKDLFKTEPFRYISKPIDSKQFTDTFLSAYKRICQKAEYFTFTYNKYLYKMPLRLISYFESRNRVLYIHTINSSSDQQENTLQKCYKKMNDVEKELVAANQRFIRIHQSYLVNYEYIRSISFTAVTLVDGTKLQISADRQKRVRLLFCNMLSSDSPNMQQR
ncbi:MAG: LytR/AlgR family response regulator transcription factor [Acetatifactor sp.]